MLSVIAAVLALCSSAFAGGGSVSGNVNGDLVNATIPAANVDPGTFGSGNYTFPYSLTAGSITVSNTNSSDVSYGGSILSSTTGNTFQIQQKGINGSATTNGLSLVCENANSTCFGMSGYPISVGVAKIVGNSTGTTNGNASVLSLRYNGVGSGINTAMQGIFLDNDNGWSTGKMLNIRNNATEFFVVGPTTGAVSIGLQGAANNAQLHVKDVRGVTTNMVQVDDKNGNTQFAIQQSSLTIINTNLRMNVNVTTATVLGMTSELSYDVVTTTTTTADTAERIFSTHTITAAQFAAYGDCIEITCLWSGAPDANTKQGIIRAGTNANSVSNTKISDTTARATNNGGLKNWARIQELTTANSQWFWGQGDASASSSASNFGTLSLTTASSFAVTCSCKNGSAVQGECSYIASWVNACRGTGP